MAMLMSMQLERLPTDQSGGKAEPKAVIMLVDAHPVFVF